MSSRTMKDVLETAREIYVKTEHGTGCCGDLNGALEYIDGSVGEMVQGIVNTLVDRDLTNELFRIGLNGWGDVVMLCDVCGETFAKKVQDKTLAELCRIRADHKCERGPSDAGEPDRQP